MSKKFLILLFVLGSCNKSTGENTIKNKGASLMVRHDDRLLREKPSIERSFSSQLADINLDNLDVQEDNQIKMELFSNLIKAVSTGNQEEVIRLIEAGADVNMKNQYGQTALMTATYLMNYSENDIYGLDEIDVNSSYNVSDINIINILINAGANIDEQDEDGNTALVHAIKNNNMDAIALLLELNANYNLQNTIGETPLMFAVFAIHNDINGLQFSEDDLYVNSIDLLIEKGVFLDGVDLEGNTALHYAFSIESIMSIKTLIEAGANQNIENNLGVTSYNMAILSTNQQIIELFDNYNS